MNSKQFTVDDVTYEVHEKTIRDGLRVDWLYSAFFDAGYKDQRWTAAYAFSNFIVSTKVVSGEAPAYMVAPDADIATLIGALEQWLDAPSRLSAGWQEAMDAVDLNGNRKELTPQADPNA